VCAPYFVNLNNTLQFKTLLFFVHLRSQQNKTGKVISNYSFEIFRALVRSVEWSRVSGVDSPGSVPGPPQRQRSQQCASYADVHYRVLVQCTPLFAIASESPQHHPCSISCFKIPQLIVSPRTFLITRHFLWMSCLLLLTFKDFNVILS